MDVFESDDDDASQRPGDASTPRSPRRQTPDAGQPRRTSTEQEGGRGNRDQERDLEERSAAAGAETTEEELEDIEDESEDDEDDEDESEDAESR